MRATPLRACASKPAAARHVVRSGQISRSSLDERRKVTPAGLDAMSRQIDHRAAMLFLVNDERAHLVIAAGRGVSDEDREIQLAADNRAIAQLLHDRQPTLVTDPATADEILAVSGFS